MEPRPGVYFYTMTPLEQNLSKLNTLIEKVKVKHDKSEYYLNFLMSLRDSINDFILKSNQGLEYERNKSMPHIEVIKKQAMIIDAAGIQYPTINQSIETITDIWLASKGMIDDIGKGKKQNVTIKII